MNRFDVVIIGSGAAGLSAALVLSRARRIALVVDAGAPWNMPAAHMHGFLSPDGLPPADLLAVGRADVAGYGSQVVTDTATSARRCRTRAYWRSPAAFWAVAEICVSDIPAETGVSRSGPLLPVPSWPSVLRPQAQSLPVWSMA